VGSNIGQEPPIWYPEDRSFGYIIPAASANHRLIVCIDRSKKEHNPRPCCLCHSLSEVPVLTFNLVKVFDLLYLNGQSLIHKSCKFRKRNLRTCFAEKQGRIEFVTEYQGKTAKDVRERMEVVMEARGEGLILKHPDGEYVLNGRNKDWIKVC